MSMVVDCPEHHSFIVARSSPHVDLVALARGWTRRFGNALTWENGKELIRYVADVTPLRDDIYKGRRLYLGPEWRIRAHDRDTILELIGNGHLLAEEIA